MFALRHLLSRETTRPRLSLVARLAAATVAGMAFGAVSWGATRPEAHQARGADYVFDRMDQITASVLA